MDLRLSRTSTYFNTQTYFRLKTIRSSKGQSRNSTLWANYLPLYFKYTKLKTMIKSHSGRNKSGQKTLRTRGSISKKLSKIKVNFFFRSRNINFVAGFFLTPFYNKLLSLIFLSSGSVSYITATTNHKLFELQRLYTITTNVFFKNLYQNTLYSQIFIQQGFYLIRHLPKNKTISSLELLPLRGIQYIRSAGVSGTMLKLDSRLGKSVVKLPSGVKKLFSIYSTGSKGAVALTNNANFLNKKAGYKKIFGFKPQVRGVAMNPVDHPHGGRAKSIKYQRTPWGKTTKYK